MSAFCWWRTTSPHLANQMADWIGNRLKKSLLSKSPTPTENEHEIPLPTRLRLPPWSNVSPASAWPDVCRLCAASGVAVVLVPELPDTHVFGFTRWLTPDKALIQLSLRYKTDDLLWFTFFHEAAHILLHGKRDVFAGYIADNPKEDEANRWAADFLIPPDDWSVFLSSLPAHPGPAIIQRFAKKQGIAPSIVLGRLQHREKRVSPGSFNSLKHQVEIAWKGLE